MVVPSARSGKTLIICYAMIVRALKEQSRHLCVRLRFNHAKTSLWMDTLPKVITMCFPDLHPRLEYNNQDYFIKFPNGSELWIAGLDDKTRTEKILGKEYSTIFFNESSQIPFNSVNVALTRLAQKNGLMKKAYFDENPPQKSHWSYSVFILGKDPETWEDKDKTKYASMLMNPQDNIENIDGDYITEILDNLSPEEKARFKDGIFANAAEGAIYYAFDRDKHCQIIDSRQTPPKGGCDFNVDPITACMGYYQNDKIYIDDEVYLRNSNTFELANKMFEKWNSIELFPDSTGSARKTSATKTDHQILRDKGFIVKNIPNPHVKDRQNCVNWLLSQGRLFINPRCKMLIKDMEQLTHENNDPMLSHISDALGYLCWGLVPYRKHTEISVGYYT